MEILGRLEAWKAEMQNEKNPFEKFVKNMKHLDLRPILLLADQRFKPMRKNFMGHIPDTFSKPKCQAVPDQTSPEPHLDLIPNKSDTDLKVQRQMVINNIEPDVDEQLHEKSLVSEREEKIRATFTKCRETSLEVSLDDMKTSLEISLDDMKTSLEISLDDMKSEPLDLSLNGGERGCSNDESDVVVIKLELDPVVWEEQAKIPVLQVPIPILQAPIPVLQAPIPVLQAPIPVLQAPIPVLQVPRSATKGWLDVDRTSFFNHQHHVKDIEVIDLDVLNLEIVTPQNKTLPESAKCKKYPPSLFGQEYLHSEGSRDQGDINELRQSFTKLWGHDLQCFAKEEPSSFVSESSHEGKPSGVALLTSDKNQTSGLRSDRTQGRAHELSTSFTQVHHMQTKTTMDSVKVEPSYPALKQNDEEQSHQVGNSKQRQTVNTTCYSLEQDLSPTSTLSSTHASITSECTTVAREQLHMKPAHVTTQSIKTYSKQTPQWTRGLEQYKTDHGGNMEETPARRLNSKQTPQLTRGLEQYKTDHGGNMEETPARRPNSSCFNEESKSLCNEMDTHKSKHVKQYEEDSQLCGEEENLHSQSAQVAQTYAVNSDQVLHSCQHSRPNEYMQATHLCLHHQTKPDRNERTAQEMGSGQARSIGCRHSPQPCNNVGLLAHEYVPCASVSACSKHRYKPSCQHVRRTCHHCCGENTNACVYPTRTCPCTTHGVRHTPYYGDTIAEDYLPVKKYRSRVCDYMDSDGQSQWYNSLKRAYQEAMNDCHYMYEQAHRYQREQQLWEAGNLPCNRRKRKQEFQVRDYEECTVKEDPCEVLYMGSMY